MWSHSPSFGRPCHAYKIDQPDLNDPPRQIHPAAITTDQTYPTHRTHQTHWT